MKIITDSEFLEAFFQDGNVFSVFPESVKDGMELRLFQKNEFIFLQGYLIQGFYYQLRGRVRIVHTLKNGREMNLRFVGGPRIYGGAEFFLGYPASASAQAVEPTYCLFLPFSACRGVLRQDADFLFYLGKNYAEVMYVSNHNFPINQSASHDSRIAAYLLSIEENGVFSGCLKEIPDYLGLSYRHLLRVLSAFAEKGLIEKEGKNYRILDRERLRAVAGDIYLL